MGDTVNRWKMNRLGLVNFWLYDEEEFYFENGRMLLRGQNGSGKSITTQSFIPFILDGNRNPKRLDPFGSKDRRMEYYFIGNGEKEESTGYLYLELKRGNEYRTIGIGQRAKTGNKTMDFWGFVILDGRRIGREHEILLFEEYGNQYIPFTKRKLKNILGDNNPLYDKPSEYMRAVNKYFFGFKKDEQYEQFIQLLIKVRAPKLSNVFKPSTIYNILNESIQTLTDDDISPMVDAMEKLDDIEIKLDNLRKTASDTDRILRVYDRYNRFMLYRKAYSFHEAFIKCENSKKELKSLEQKAIELEEIIKGQEEELRVVSDRINVNEERLSAWRESELFKSIENKQNLEKDVELKNDNLKKKQISIDDMNVRIMGLDKAIRELNDGLEGTISEILKTSDDIIQSDEIIHFSRTDDIVDLCRNITDKTLFQNRIEECLSDLTDFEKRVRNAKEKIVFFDKCVSEYSEALEQLTNKESELKLSENKMDEVQKKMETEKNDMIESLLIMSSENKEFNITDHIEELKSIISSFSGIEYMNQYTRIIGDAYLTCSRKIDSRIVELEQKLNDLKNELESLENEYKEIKEQKEPAPDRQGEIIKARKLLIDNNICFRSFYEVIDFAEGLTDDQKALIERQLAISGLLDGLVIYPEDELRALELLKKSDYILISSGRNVINPVHSITAFSDLDDSLKKVVDGILNSISDRRDVDADYCLSQDGYYKNGILEGMVTSVDKKACFIGVEARKRYREGQLSRKMAEIEVHRNDIEKQIEFIIFENNRKEQLETEKKNTPDIDNLNVCYSDYLESEREYNRLSRELRDLSDKLAGKEKKKNVAEKDMRSFTDLFVYACNVAAYSEVEDEIRSFNELLQDLRLTFKDYYSQVESKKDKELQKEDEEYRQDEALAEKREMEREYRGVLSRLEEVERFLGSEENRDIKEEMESLSVETKKLNEYINDLKTDIAVQIERKNSLEEKRHNAETSASELEKELNQKEQFFKEESELKLVNLDDITENTVNNSEIIINSLSIEEGKTEGDIREELRRIFDENRSGLAEYGAELSDLFENSIYEDIPRKRKIIEVKWHEVRIPIADFREELQKYIENISLLIKEKDREIFEKILSDTVSRKLTTRINESREWIKEMSSMMKTMETSMGLNFALDWIPRTAESEGQISTKELEKILIKDKTILNKEDIDKVTEHFRSKLRELKKTAELNGDSMDYAGMVKTALDFRDWFEFRMSYIRHGENKKELTNAAFNRFSGGEKAMAMYIPLFAAVNAQYKKATIESHPRIVALDEAFAGVDDKNISSMFELVESLDFDYIMNSQALWGCYETVKALGIAELQRPNNENYVTVIKYKWNGKKKVLAE